MFIPTRDPLLLLRASILHGTPAKLYKGDREVSSFEEATHLYFSCGTKVDLKEETRFIRRATGEMFNMQAIYFAWLLRDSNVAEYIQRCGETDIKNLSFLEKTDLVAWLDGAPESEHLLPLDNTIKHIATSNTSVHRMGFDRPERNSVILKIYSQERTIASRSTDFSSVRKDAYEHFISKLRNKQAPPVEHKLKRRDPIILLSPSASSLLTMHNIKQFLEDGVFVTPEQAIQVSGNNRSAELIVISHTSRIAKGLSYRFVIVQDVEKFRPDYWDRVVCVFTTGQAWQFKEYKWSEPRELFHHVKGFLIQYVGDPPHPATKEWNVESIRIERNRRHTDREVVSRLWESLERWMDNHPIWRSMGRPINKT
ncbi:hypothetical protein PCANB_000146 [Pneumocystis canis]|nr:hypothetical protein PCANB_000146 [Pneumocystis canis]